MSLPRQMLTSSASTTGTSTWREKGSILAGKLGKPACATKPSKKEASRAQRVSVILVAGRPPSRASWPEAAPLSTTVRVDVRLTGSAVSKTNS